MHDPVNLKDRERFHGFFQEVFDYDIDYLTDENLILMYTLFQYQAERMLSLMGERELVGQLGGAPYIPYVLPAGLEEPPTVLNGGQEPTGHVAG